MIKYYHYKVSWGDKLDTIANRFNIDVQDLKYLNRIKDIYIGQILLIPIEVNIPIPNKTYAVSLTTCLERHIKRKRYFNFYTYQKSHQS
ncbi:MAG TPA: LysM peptidoglycan-binding domain-containing protein [Haloplasmataceae bacterium]